jgi:purine-binding chemotaxis protein CheW
MSGHDLIDDYLSELMDDPGKGRPASAAAAKQTAKPAAQEEPVQASASIATPSPPKSPDPAPTPAEQAPDIDPLAAFRDGSPHIGDDEFEAMLDALHGGGATAPAGDVPAETSGADVARERPDPLASFRDGGDQIGEDEFEAMLDALQGAPSPAATHAPAAVPASDPLAAFRQGSDQIGEDEFDAMLDALQGAPASSGPPADPLAAFRAGGEVIGEDEFEAMLDALQAPGAAHVPPGATQSNAAPAVARPAKPAAAAVPTRAIEALLPPADLASSHAESILSPERRRRAEDRVTSWLRFNLARQCFAVEVLKVQEVLRVPPILPVRGTDEATLGVMNLRGQIVPVMDLAVRLGFSPTQPNEASRVIVLEEKGETLGLMVASVADVLNLSEGRMERISGTPSLVAAEVVRGVSRREGHIVIMLDASRLLA